MTTVDDWKELLRTRIRAALGARDTSALAVLRPTLAAIENAEAAPVGAQAKAEGGVFAGSVAGLGAGEVARLVLAPEQVLAVVERELGERRAAAAEYARLGRQEEAAGLAQQAALLEELLRPTIDRGDLFWIAPDDAPGPAHPHLVVQDDTFNHSRISTVVVCALTSNLGKASEPGNVLLEPGEGGLPQQSVVVVSQICSVVKTRLGARVGSLSQARVDQVIAGLRFLQRSFFTR